MTTSKQSYQTKLLDPRWQRKRLEALQKAEFACEMCYDAESTLHVHHKQYLKGREPWEYEVDQLGVLCKDCHEQMHNEEDKLNLVQSYAPLDGPRTRDGCASLLAGFLGLDMSNEFVDDPDLYVLGCLVAKLQFFRFFPSDLHEWCCDHGNKNLEQLMTILSRKPTKGFEI